LAQNNRLIFNNDEKSEPAAIDFAAGSYYNIAD
jgi:hypothetical protein